MKQLEKGYNYLDKNAYFFGEVPNLRAVEIADYKFYSNYRMFHMDFRVLGSGIGGFQ